MTNANAEWKKTACILCSVNCGLEVQTENGHITKIRGDKEHPTSQGYQCQKSTRLDHYQNHEHRVTSPLRRRADGSFEEISWDTAISEVAAKLKDIRDTHGGNAIAYFGGGGQGNHLGGAYGGAFRAACGTHFLYTSLAQEKTGGFWLNGKLFGKQSFIPLSDHHNSDFLLAIGWNPWQSHGMAQARKELQKISKNKECTFAVIDPRRSETAEKADYHLQVRPGGDAHLMLAMLGFMVQEDLHDKEFIAQHCVNFEPLRATLDDIPVDAYCEEAGVDAELVKDVTRKMAAAKGLAVHTDLGLEHSLHSTLNLYLSKLLWLLTGNFANEGGQVLFPPFVPLIGNSKDPQDGGRATRVTGAREIGKLYPPNSLAPEIDNDSDDRLRALFVDSGNPAMTAADARATRASFEKLDLLVTVDVAMTETARLSHYILPAQTQFEKWEATFFNLFYPENSFHLRAPIFEPTGNTLPEPEIYRRLVVAMGALPEELPELEKAAHAHVKDPSKGIFPMAFMETMQQRPELSKYGSLILYMTLGKALPDGAASAAALWGTCQQFAQKYPNYIAAAGIEDAGGGLGESLFWKIMEGRSGVIFSKSSPSQTWDFVVNPEQKIHLTVPEMLEEIEELEQEQHDPEFPYIVSAGERRSYNANQIYRTKAWRKSDVDGALKVHPSDAETIGLEDAGMATVRSRSGSIDVSVAVTDEVREGFMTLPHGYGQLDNDGVGALAPSGPDINVLSNSDHCDRIAKTPFHKYIPCEVVPAMVPAK